MRPGGWIYGDNPGAKLLEGPEYENGKWQHIAILYRRDKSELSIYVQGKVKKHKLGIQPHIGFLSKQIELHSNGQTDYAIDNLHVLNYVLTKPELSTFYSNRFVSPSLPMDNLHVHPEKVALSWSNNSGKRAQVQLALDPEFTQIVTTKKSISGVILPSLKNDTRYFWRVNHPQASSKNEFLTSKMIRSFYTDETVVPLNFTIRDIQLPDAKIKTPGYNQRLAPFIDGITDEAKKRLVYRKASGPSWLRVLPDGTLITNYGPAKRDRGKNRFRVRISATDGTTKLATFSIKAVN